MAAETTIAPSVPSGFARWKGPITGGLAFLTVVYGIVYFLVNNSVRVKSAEGRIVLLL